MEEGMNLMEETAAYSAAAAADFKYICSLSTILVATIQELKDRVSQIELIFCSQLFPKIQSSCGSGGGGRRRKEELEWRGKESELLAQIEELRGSLVKEREERERLAKEVESRDRGLSAEQSKRRDMAREFGTLKERYNSLKSQYTYLLGKLEGNSGNVKGSERVAEEEEKARDHSSRRSHEDIEEIHTKEISPCNDHGKPKFNLSSLSPSTRTTPSCTADFEEFGTKKISPHSEPRKQKLNLNSLSTSTRPPKNCISVKEENLSWCQTNKISTSPRLFPKPPSGKTTETLVGQKRPTMWRDTRAHQKPGGANPDPHDDFLDTPIEMARASRLDKSSTSPACGAPVPQELGRDKLPVEEPTAFQVPAPQDMDFNNSDEETQDLTSNKISIQSKENKFKFIEPVRKKAERENLKGIECKQCKKFYDAVLPENGEGKGSDGIGNSLRCEHHEGVSRHRYRYAPPLTPSYSFPSRCYILGMLVVVQIKQKIV